MLRHLVLCKAKPEATHEQIKAIVAALNELPPIIPEIQNWSAGVNVVESPRAYSLGLSADFADLEALRAYQRHPAHQQVLNEQLLPLCSSIVSVDYEL